MNKGTKRNQCDGCQAGVPLENGKHRMGRPGGYPDLMKLHSPSLWGAASTACGMGHFRRRLDLGPHG